ncbi:hypothetical protein RGR602_PC01993 (plasmid) [Rhizobium gallicum bv. gallicum R602sp]|uniref:Uncharacterized protein n=1 Tax=Rhizobium gallicum bv. gallicum R602sp TaxID=1041138 RepID=A0A0B4XG15_9HYPH|nr:hypothetical protein RGR602_PC01993 [Rhizobium gallicum bv. gallicum R602sp]
MLLNLETPPDRLLRVRRCQPKASQADKRSPGKRRNGHPTGHYGSNLQLSVEQIFSSLFPTDEHVA